MTQLSKYDPFRSIFSLPRFLDDFEDFNSQRGLRIRETENEIITEAVVAGVPSKNVDVHVEDGVLTIKAEATNEQKSYQYYYTVALSGGQWDKADAEVKNGVVTVKIPKAEAVKPRKISVRESKD